MTQASTEQASSADCLWQQSQPEALPNIEAVPVVNSHNEWDLLEEVIVGHAENACVPEWHPVLQATMPARHWNFFRQNGGQPFPAELIAAAERELHVFCRELEAQGVTVRRPEPVDWQQSYSTPDVASAAGLYAAMPRDLLLVVGNEIIEAPMAWPSRLFESRAYRPLIKHYFEHGARWTAAPKPQLSAQTFNHTVADEGYDLNAGRSVITEFEPIPVHFRNFGSLGGAFHCATCDIRRRGNLKSYF